MSSKRALFARANGAITLVLLAVLLLSSVSPAFALSSNTVASITVGLQTGSATYGSAGNVTYDVAVASTGGTGKFTIRLSVVGLPVGATGTFTIKSLSFNSGAAQTLHSVLKVSTVATLAPGARQFSVKNNRNSVSGIGTLTIDKKALHVTGITANNKVYDATTSASLNTSGAVLVGVVPPDVITLDASSAVGSFSSADVGNSKVVNISGVAFNGANAVRYTLVQPSATANITPALLTVQALPKTIATDLAVAPSFDKLVTGFKGSDGMSVVSGLACSAYKDEAGTQPVTYPADAGNYYILCGGGNAANYTFDYQSATLLVTSAGAPKLSVPTLSSFPARQVGTSSLVRAISVQNLGSLDLHLFGIALSGAQAGQYQLVTKGSTCYNAGWPTLANPMVVHGGSACTINLKFSPTAVGTATAKLDITSDNAVSPVSVTLSGSAVYGTQIMLNRSFEIDANNNKMPDNWLKGGTWAPVSGQDCTVRYAGKCSLKIVANGKTSIAQQTLAIKGGGAGNGYIFSLYSKTGSVSIPSNAKYSANLMFYNNTTLVGSASMGFNKGVHGWQAVKFAYTVPAVYNKIVIQIIFQASAGTVWFDLGSLTR